MRVGVHVAGGVVIDPRGRVAVVSQFGTSWSLPKGHVESGEDLVTAATREIVEETGVEDARLRGFLGAYDRSAIRPDGSIDDSRTKTIHMFLFTCPTRELIPRDPENPSALWVELSEAESLLTHPADRSFLTRAREEIFRLIERQA